MDCAINEFVEKLIVELKNKQGNSRTTNPTKENIANFLVELEEVMSFKKDSYINIWSTNKDEYRNLSNLNTGPITVKGLHFATVEGMYQYSKAMFAGDKETATKILNLNYNNYDSKGNRWNPSKVTGLDKSYTSGVAAQKLGKKVKNLNVEEWNKVSESKLYQSMRLYYKNNPEAAKLLLSTGDSILTHKKDNVEQDKGRFSKLLTKIREELKSGTLTSNDGTKQSVRPVKTKIESVKPGTVTIADKDWTRESAAADSDNIYIFGDNVKDSGSDYFPKSTQAMIRGLPNAFGINTKKSRNPTKEAQFTEADYDEFMDYIYERFEELERLRDEGRTFVVSKNGIGTGKANLPAKLHNQLALRFNTFVGQELIAYKGSKPVDTTIDYTPIPRDKTKPLASASRTEIKLQEGLTAKDIVEYLTTTKTSIKELQKIVANRTKITEQVNTELNMDLYTALRTMDDNTANEFLLLYENKRQSQMNEYNSVKEFKTAYTANIISFEKDAIVWATMLLELQHMPTPSIDINEKTEVKDGTVIVKQDALTSTQTEYIKKQVDNILKSAVDRGSNKKGQVAVAFGPTEYSYSAGRGRTITHKQKDMPKWVSALAAHAEDSLNKPKGYYNHVLINKFDDTVGIGAHKDNEAIYEEKDGTIGSVATYSIGDTQDNHKIGGKDFKASNGSLIEMSTGNITHSVSPAKGTRYSITFRHIPDRDIKNKAPKKESKLKYSDIEDILNREKLQGPLSTVIGNDVEYISDDGVPYTRNHKEKIDTIPGTFWNELGINRDVLRRAIYSLQTVKKPYSKLTDAQKNAIDTMTKLTKQDIEYKLEMAERAMTSLGSGISYDIEVSDKALEEITKFNNKYIRDNKINIVESNIFSYDTKDGTVKVDASTSNAEYQVLLKHELLHHLTYKRVTKDLSKASKLKLIKELEKVNDMFDSMHKIGNAGVISQRLRYALDKNDLDVKVAEAVAVIGAEPQIREALESITDVSLLKKIVKRFINAVKQYLGNEKELAESTKYVLDNVDQIIKDSSEKQLQLDPKSNSLLVPIKGSTIYDANDFKKDGFMPKDEIHMTVLGFPQGREIIKWKETASKTDMDKMQDMINTADFTYEETKELYKISRDREAWKDWKDHTKGKETLHEEAIIQLIKAPGVEDFINDVNREFGFNFPVPFPHMSLAVKGTKFGIGIANEEAFQELNPVRIDGVHNQQNSNNKTDVDELIKNISKELC